MCIVCAISRWSRNIVTMLAWILVPFILLWVFTQLLAVGFQLEVTSSRLACFGVLLSSLAWYEVIIPRFSSLQERRNILSRERKISEAQEAAKWQKEATRRCRNCLMTYRVQNPRGGRFMCTFCGHVSKRPVLEMPGTVPSCCVRTIGVTSSGCYSTSRLVDRAGMHHHKDSGWRNGGKAFSWPFAPDKEACQWFGRLWPSAVAHSYGVKCGSAGAKPGNIVWKCKAESSCVGALTVLKTVYSPLQWIWLKLFSSIEPRKGSSTSGLRSETENLSSLVGSRGEKARRKAKEKKQARFEKELSEAEEKRQREEVALMVDEQRRQREEKAGEGTEADQGIEKQCSSNREIDRPPKDQVRENSSKAIKDKARGIESNANLRESKSVLSISDLKNVTKLVSTSHRTGLHGNVSVLTSEKGSHFRSRADAFIRLGVSAYTERKGASSTAKGGTQLVKDIQARSAVDGSLATQKLTKPEPHATNALDSKSKSVRAIPTFGSVWKKTPKGCGSDQERDLLNKDTYVLHKGLMNKDRHLKPIGSKQTAVGNSLSSEGCSTNQPQSAIPSTHIDSLQQLFTCPSIFPSVDLADLQKCHNEGLKCVSNTTFIPGSVFVGPCQQTSFKYPDGPNFALDDCSPVPVPVPVSLAPFPSAADKPITHLELSPLPVDLHVNVSSIAYPVSFSPILKPTKLDETELSLDKDDSIHWNLPSIVAENYCDIELHEVKVLDSSPWFTSDKQAELDVSIQRQGSLTSWIEMPQLGSLLSEQNDLMPSFIEAPCELTMKRKSFFPLFDTTMRIWDDIDLHQKMPAEFVDCITQEIMEDPVITADGHSYERTAIEQWLKLHDTSPKTGEVLPPPPNGIGVDKTLRPNHILRGQIIEYKEHFTRVKLVQAQRST